MATAWGNFEGCTCDARVPPLTPAPAPSPSPPSLPQPRRSNFTDTKALQAAVLVVGVVGSLAYLYLLGKPYFAATQAEPRKVAEVSCGWAGACRG